MSIGFTEYDNVLRNVSKTLNKQLKNTKPKPSPRNNPLLRQNTGATPNVPFLNQMLGVSNQIRQQMNPLTSTGGKQEFNALTSTGVRDPFAAFSQATNRSDPMDNLYGVKGATRAGTARDFFNQGNDPFSGGFGLKTIRDRIAAKQAAASGYVGGGDPSGARGLEGTEQWKPLMERAAQETGVPWQVLAAIMGIETGGQNIGANGAGAMGLMQIVGDIWQQTANQYGGNLMDPWTNIRTAAHILKSNYDTYGSWDKAAAAYFGGGGAFNADGSFSDNADYFGTNISQYVGIFRNNMAALGYGTPSAAEYTAGGAAANPWAQNAVNNAMSAQGTPYVWGGESPGGFDCSGLMQWAYGGKLDHARTAEQQYYATQRINGQDLQAGDLIFFNTIGGISHVGMYIGNGQMIHAPKENDIVKIVSLDNDYWRNATVGYGRVN